MTEETWRPLGVDTDEEAAEYDALHDDVPEWMASAFWAWVRDAITTIRRYSDGSGKVPALNEQLVEPMCQELRIALPTLRMPETDYSTGQSHLKIAMATLEGHRRPLQIADYLLAHNSNAHGKDLEAVLGRSKSAWTVGTRAGRPGLVRRVPLGVQSAADAVMVRSGRAGIRLARAWEQLYGIDPNPSEAYRLAILAVEDAAIPVVSPNNQRATLGTVLSQMEAQDDWQLPMEREHENALSSHVLVGMMRVLWHGQHDRHGGQPSAPGAVSLAEARVALNLAVGLVDWFSADLIQRAT